MSGRRRPLTFTNDARADLRAILLYTRRTWGAAQRQRYADQFRRAFDDLRAFPEVGSRRDELYDGARAYRVQHHVVYYVLLPDTFQVIRILHESEDATTKLSDTAP